ncbi:MAG: Crp/Fnr family transcriptional regulator [Eubacterium sp.]|nr:Crp/Fnr family transcriptional regulator [Eubacterium sp.]
MDYTVLERSTLFHGLSSKDLREILESVSHHIQYYDKDEIIFHLMEEADRIGIILEGRAEAQKPFPNGSQVNVSIRNPGEMVGPAAVFSSSQQYPCDVMAIEPVTLMMFRKKDLLQLLQKDIRILENFTREIASATYMLQQRLELLSYSGIAQKAAFYLLMQRRRTGSDQIRIPESITKWAMMMNVSRPSLHRELKRLEAQGIISYHSHIIEIPDPDALQAVLG